MSERRRTGYEIELLAPEGSSRLELARLLASRCGGAVRPVWHQDSEPSLVPGLGRFWHLTQGFAVHRRDGGLLATLVDDVTLRADLDPRARPADGWHRLLTDDGRLLRLLRARCDPAAPLDAVLEPAAELWQVPVQQHGAVRRVDDPSGATVALAAPQGGERERPCEVVTPPLVHDHEAALEALLGPARELGFTVPLEAAVHLHVDGAPFRDAAVLARVVRLFSTWREPLRLALRTNPACTRLAPLPRQLVDAATGAPTRAQLQGAAREAGLTKFFDVNLTALLADAPERDTLEVRVLPGATAAAELLRGADLVQDLLDACLAPEPLTDALVLGLLDRA